jgi:hypothetical protein
MTATSGLNVGIFCANVGDGFVFFEPGRAFVDDVVGGYLQRV